MSSSAGRVLIIPKGEYNSATQYQMLDAVRYNGSLYIAKKTTIGHVPADGEYWMLCATGASNIRWGDIIGSIANQSDLNTALNAKQNALTFDSTPTASSNNPVTSAGIKTALDTKQNTLTFDTTPTSGSTNPVTSGGVFTAVNATASNLATIESSTTASQAYSAGDYLVLNGQLYKVTADVASGETLVIGTNIEATTAGAELKALNNDLESHYMNYETLENEYVTVNPSIVNTSEYYKVEIWSRSTEAYVQVSFKLKTAVSNNTSPTVLNFTSKITELLSATYRTFTGFIESGTYAGRCCVLHLDTWNDTKELEMYNTLGGSIPVGSQMTFSFYVMK